MQDIQLKSTARQSAKLGPVAFIAKLLRESKNGYLRNQLIGKSGELIARMYLRAHFYQIIQSNLKLKSGEIDIIAAYQDQLIFIEVKTSLKKSTLFPAINRIDRNKQEKLRLLASHYIHSFRSEYLKYNVKKLRFDGIAVCLGNFPGNLMQKEALLKHHRSLF